MTTAGRHLALRTPRWVRVLGPALLALWLWVFLFREEALDDVLVPGLLVAGFAATVIGRLLFLSVIGTGDGRLTVRNTWSTRTFCRAEVLGVEIDRAAERSGRGWAVWLRLADGNRHRLDVTEAPFLGPFRVTLERQAGAVRAWLSADTR